MTTFPATLPERPDPYALGIDKGILASYQSPRKAHRYLRHKQYPMDVLEADEMAYKKKKNDDGTYNRVDVTWIVNYVFGMSKEPPKTEKKPMRVKIRSGQRWYAAKVFFEKNGLPDGYDSASDAASYLPEDKYRTLAFPKTVTSA